jgi:hypothetical protein
MPMDPYDPDPCIKGENELEPDTISRVPLEKSEILDFLKNEGLLRILISNSLIKREDLLVWLSRGPTGKITFTFSPSRGLIGGAMVPYGAYDLGGRIDAPMKDEVATFLLSFGLTPEEAEDVIRAVGTTPVRKPRRHKAKTT